MGVTTSASEPQRPVTYVAVDIETTGLDPESHGICQIGAWATGETLAQFRGYYVSDCHPYLPFIIEESALKVNGFTADRIRASRSISVVIREFAEFIRGLSKDSDVVLVFHNAPFDVGFLNRAFNLEPLDDGAFRRVLDTVTLGFAVFGKPMSLASLAEQCGVTNGAAHDGLGDAYTTISIFHELRATLQRLALT